MGLLLLITGLSLSIIAGFFAVVGLIIIFSAQPIVIGILGGGLEISKVVLVSALYRNWRIVPGALKLYLLSAIFVLMVITSTGVYGYLSKAHLQHATENSGNSLQIEFLNKSIAQEQKVIADAELVISQLDKAVQVLIDYDRIRGKDGAIAVRAAQKDERAELNSVIKNSIDSINELNAEKFELEQKKINLQNEVGAILYVALLFYDEVDDERLKQTIIWFILLIVLVLDPLAISMLLAANVIIKNREREKLPPIKIIPQNTKEKKEEKEEEKKEENIIVKPVEFPDIAGKARRRFVRPSAAPVKPVEFPDIAGEVKENKEAKTEVINNKNTGVDSFETFDVEEKDEKEYITFTIGDKLPPIEEAIKGIKTSSK